ncbi:sulfotransferase [Paraglaciecola sp.]|uniref:sulfotransferase family protein n=1 Tax=Paraglaciecola sp. TaxID=1920173 RepID=UPI00326534A2
MAKPDFLVIGAQKAGTTWLDKMFKSHPDIWTPPVKELQFFNSYYMSEAFKWTRAHRKNHALKSIEYAISNKENINWNKVRLSVHIGEPVKVDYNWYNKVFDYALPNTCKGEMSPEYSLLNQKHINEISKFYPNLKIILVIRDPVERAISGIQMRLLQNSLSEADQEVIDRFVISASSDWDVIERGNYASIIEKYSRSFDSNNLKIYLSDDFKASPQSCLESLSLFLQVDSSKFKAEVNQRVHVGKQFKISKDAIGSVVEHQKANSSWYKENKERFRVL